MAEKVKVKKEKVEAKETGVKSVYQLKRELAKLTLDIKMGQEKDTSKVKKLKKEIARLLTKANGN